MRRIFIACALFALSYQMMADDNEPKPVVIHFTHKGNNQGTEEIPRAPMRVPSLYIEGHNLSFSPSCQGCTLQLWQDEVLIYTYFIQDEDDLELPAELAGEYEIRLLMGSLTFVGTIEI